MKKERFSTNTELVFYFLRGSKRWFLLAILFTSLTSLLDLVNPKIVGYTVDYLITSNNVEIPENISYWISRFGGVEFLSTHLYYIAIAILLIAALDGVTRFLFRYCNAIGAETLVARMRNTLFEHIQTLPVSWQNDHHTGDIIQRCTSDVDQIKSFLSEQITSLFRVSILVVTALFFMSRINVRLTFVSAIFFPIIVGYSILFHGKIGERFRLADEAEGEVSSIVQENLTGVRVVRAFGREIEERNRFETKNEEYTNFWIRLLRLMSAYWASSDIMSYTQVLAVSMFGVVMVMNGQMSLGDYITFFSYNAMLTWPVRTLGRVITSLSRAGISLDRLREILNGESEENPVDAKKPNFSQDITFDHVNFHFGNELVLNDLNFTIPVGSTVGILGSTGSGKSIITAILDRLYDLKDDEGHIYIGDTDLSTIDRQWVRQNIGLVLQEPYLFSRTLKENITIANQNATMDDVHRVSDIASLTSSIEKFRDGYETFVGERGVTLSGGQKQRVAIAQMLIRNTPIMIFDDSLSAVDAETDVQIRQALKTSTTDATVILIAHRITTIMNADQIFVMDKGKIIEHGTHEELLTHDDGIYRQIYDLQIRQSDIGKEDL